MTDPSLSFEIEGEEQAIEIPDERLTIRGDVTQVAENHYCLDSIPFMTESLNYKDVIEAKRLDDGTLRFAQVIKPSNWKTHCYVLSCASIESKQTQDALDMVESLNGIWERVMGGMLLVSIPPDSDWDPTSAITS